MPKTRKQRLAPDVLRKLEEIEERARQRRLEVADLIVRTERIRQRLREMAAGRVR